ncbi:class I SAM-dependent methyltransferase [Alsobacter sp. SYSU M60028]|uniref:Class I SAM-dependent methyltransferase n=1 Tax=Alsobacter ponti TaxID=2962936 RepID=A0ABT1LL07_9HYPH|nr:class I SAM-dependent methyltransferase [Alsobacter ponti]MCP8940938.1 class I SAM-dependent methyltransferase [Alsobacter ponti]
MTAARGRAMGLATALGWARRGFVIPYRYAASATPAAYPALEPLFAAATPSFRAVLACIEDHAAELSAIGGGEGQARFDQDWFPRLDAAAAYALVRRERPARIVEIGSGHSTRFLARAVRDGGLATRIACVDPAPRASLAALDVTHHAVTLDAADPALTSSLGAGDVLFIDSSHIAMPGTDVDRLVLDVLPRLGAGALVHIHDILLPDAYPDDWAWRGYNEQIVIGALLQGGGYELVFASHYVAARLRDEARAGVLGRLALARGARETSLWLRKR